MLLRFLLQKYIFHFISENLFSERRYFFSEPTIETQKDGITSCVIPSLKYNNVMVMKSHILASRHDFHSHDGHIPRLNR
jgi:hypothetical protein